jgi:hypothetical protein
MVKLMVKLMANLLEEQAQPAKPVDKIMVQLMEYMSRIPITIQMKTIPREMG